MRENTEIYKKIGKEEYVITTIVRPSDTMADIKWHVRKRPYHGSTTFKVLYESRETAIPLIKGRLTASDIWNHTMLCIRKDIDDYIAKQKVGEEVAQKDIEAKREQDNLAAQFKQEK